MANSIAYSYLRFSHPDQAKGDSLRRQTELRDGWLKRNRVPLDTSLTLRDSGVSGFTGAHRDNPDRHALAAFLRAVETRRIARGSYLIVESLDRLSREDILPALTLVLNLIQAGVRIVQLLPVEVVYDEKANPMQIMMCIMELSRGHSESAMKSERVGAAWRDKRRRAADTGEPLTARTPAWLRLDNGEWRVDEQAAGTIRLIYRMAREGHGLIAITKRLNVDGVAVFSGRANHWALSYVHKILSNRAVTGEYQPYTGRGAKRKPIGKPIPNYYPAVITDDEWYAARAAAAARRERPGRPAKAGVNLFAGLVRDARDGGTMQITNKGKKGGGPLLVSYKAVQGVEGSRMASFPLPTLEAAVLSCLREIDPRELLPRGGAPADETLQLAGRLVEVETREADIKAKMRDPKFSGLDALAEVLVSLAAEKAAVAERLTEARQRAACPLGEAWGECQSLLQALASAPDHEDARTRLRAAMRRVISGAWMLVVPRGSKRLAAVQIHFDGGRHRDYLILHVPKRGGAVARSDSRWQCVSFASAGAPDTLDLRRKDHVARLEKVLGKLDLRGFAKHEKPGYFSDLS